jgi:hypothetical protein
MAAERLPWNMAIHFKDHGMCEAFLQVAQDQYPDLLLKVRESIALAMSGWLVEDGVGADVRWSGPDKCFAGRLKGVDEDINFHGETPAEVQKAFTEAVRTYRFMHEV